LSVAADHNFTTITSQLAKQAIELSREQRDGRGNSDSTTANNDDDSKTVHNRVINNQYQIKLEDRTSREHRCESTVATADKLSRS